MRTLTVDSWAWLEYFEGNPKVKTAIEESHLVTPSIVFAEVNKSLMRKQTPEKKKQEYLNFISSKSIVLPLDQITATKAGEASHNEKLPLADAIIYAFTTQDAPLLTGDPHFKNKKNVEYIE